MFTAVFVSENKRLETVHKKSWSAQTVSDSQSVHRYEGWYHVAQVETVIRYAQFVGVNIFAYVHEMSATIVSSALFVIIGITISIIRHLFTSFISACCLI